MRRRLLAALPLALAFAVAGVRRDAGGGQAQ